MSRPHIFPSQAEARGKIVFSIKNSLNNITIFKDNLHFRAELKSFFDFIENQEIDFGDEEAGRDINDFISTFFDEIRQLTLDARILCMAEVDKLLGMKLAHDNADFSSMKAQKIKDQRLAELAAALLAKSEKIGPSACLTHLFQYFEHGSVAINRVSFWTLTHLSKFQKIALMDLLSAAHKGDFSEALLRLESDLKAAVKVI